MWKHWEHKKKNIVCRENWGAHPEAGRW